MRKSIVILAVTAIMLFSLPVTVLAHGHGNRSAVQSYTLCFQESCNTAGDHLHDGITYAGHYYGDGHTYHHAGGHRARGHH